MKRQKFGIAEGMRSRLPAIGTGFYLLAFVSASIYPVFDRRPFSGLIAVLLGWPWIDYVPSAWFPLTILLNAIIIYGFLAFLSLMPTLVRQALRELKLVSTIQAEKCQPAVSKNGGVKHWKVFLPGVILLAVAQLPLIALQMTNADLLALRMAWPVYSVPLTICGCIALAVGVAVYLWRSQSSN
jgi:hypothetical protein